MLKLKVSYKNAQGVNVEKTFEKFKQAVKFVETCLAFGVENVKLETFKITEK